MSAPLKPLNQQTGNGKRLFGILVILCLVIGVAGYETTEPSGTQLKGGYTEIIHTTDEPQVEGAQTAPEPAEYIAPEDVIEPETPTTDAREASYTIMSVSDGDTVKASVNGKTETLRLIGVDTPETVDPRKTVQCFGHEASDFTKKSLLGKSVHIHADSTQADRDKYGRLLRYVFLEDGTNFNLQLIQAGYAFEYTYKVPYQYQKEFKAAQASASTQKKGLWSPNTCSGKHG